VKPDVLYPRAQGLWTGRATNDEGRQVFGRYDPERRRFEEASPFEDSELPALRCWLEHGELQSYRPGRRATIRHGEHFIKVLPPKKARRLQAKMSALTRVAGSSGVVRGPVGFRESGALVFERCEGASLHEALMSGEQRLPEMLERVGRGLARLHECRPTGLSTRSPEDAGAWASVVASHYPGRAPSYQSIGEAVDALPRDASPVGVVHGDLHDKNVFVSERGVELIDLDMVHAGDPLEDLGNLSAHLLLRSLQRPTGATPAQGWSGAMVTGYRSAGGWAPERALEAASVRVLFRLACLYLFRRRWTHVAPVLLSEAEHRCELLTTQSRPVHAHART